MEYLPGIRGLWLCSLVWTSSASVITPRAPVPSGYVAAPYYPTPYGGWAADWSDSYARAADLVSQMTLAEKVNITAGTGMYMGKL
jgi:beta-glucosidase